jgi:MprA protease rhombosortase-interaction domain-containing protein
MPAGAARLSHVYSISADGSTVVGEVTSPTGIRAGYWRASTGVQTIRDARREFSPFYATAASADGSTIVGAAFGIEEPYQGFVFDAVDGFRALGGLPDIPPGLAIPTAVSADGSIVAGGMDSGFIWDAANGMRSLADYTGGAFGQPVIDISDDGTTILGWNSVSSAATGRQSLRGFEAHAISGDGTTVVGDLHHAYIWDAEHGERLLSGPPIATESRAWGVSRDGSTVVGTYEAFPTYRRSSFIWNATSGFIDLQVLLASLGISTEGWVLQARTISADGLTIAGNGVNPDGASEAWVAMIPEPQTALLLAIGLAGFATRRERASA